MRRRELKRLKQMLRGLTPWQRQEVLAELHEPESEGEVVSRIEVRHARELAARAVTRATWCVTARPMGWMRRFNGVATGYLENYLGWFRALDQPASLPFKPASWLASPLGYAPD